MLDATRVVAFGAVGYNAVMELTYGVAFRLAQLCWAGFGPANYGWLASRTWAAASAVAILACAFAAAYG
jgi:hypothetical protein